MRVAMAGCAGWQFTTGVGPDGVPAALAFTTSAAAFTLVAVAGPSLETVARTVATSPAFRNSDPLLLATLTLLMLNLLTSMVRFWKSALGAGVTTLFTSEVAESCTLNVSGYADGVSVTNPVIFPVAEVNMSCCGKAPAVLNQLVAPMPPTDISVVL